MNKKIIVFIGSDGSGKSTLIKHVKNQLEKENTPTDIFFMGWKDFYNPLVRMLSKFYLKRKDKSNEEKLKRYRPRSWIFYIVYYIELWTRYLKVLASKKKYVLLDRYFFDELAFADGFKFKLFKLLTPKPDTCLLLKCSPEILKKRGVVVSQENFDNFYKNLESIKNFFPLFVIDSSPSLQKVYKKIENIIFDKKT